MQQADVVGNRQLAAGFMPPGPIEDENGVAAGGHL